MSVLPYLYELHNGEGITSTVDGSRHLDLDGFDLDDEEFERFNAQLMGGGYSSSGGSIQHLNEMTVRSMVSNASKASKTSKSSRTSTKCKLGSWSQVQVHGLLVDDIPRYTDFSFPPTNSDTVLFPVKENEIRPIPG